jgi:hypothetical protein
VRGQREGQIGFTSTCTRVDVLAKRARVFDAAGNVSEPAEYTMNCTSPTSGGTPPASAGSLRDFDLKNNDLMDDPEFFAIIDAWILGQIDDPTFFKAMDLWISQESLASARLWREALPLNSVSLGLSSEGRAITFIARGQGIASIGVQLYDLNGQRLLAQATAGARLRWNLRTASGDAVANGVYLYIITVRGPHGERLQSEVRKLTVWR